MFSSSHHMMYPQIINKLYLSSSLEKKANEHTRLHINKDPLVAKQIQHIALQIEILCDSLTESTKRNFIDRTSLLALCCISCLSSLSSLTTGFLLRYFFSRPSGILLCLFILLIMWRIASETTKSCPHTNLVLMNRGGSVAEF